MRLFGRGPKFPELFTLFNQTTVAPGRTRTHAIFRTRKRKGPLGWLYARLLLWVTRTAHHVLRGQDAVVYRNMRFEPSVDDWNWVRVRKGTFAAFRKLGYQLLFERALPGERPRDDENWWNGLYVAVIRRRK